MLLFDDPETRDLTFAKPDDGKSYSAIAREAVTNLGDVVERPQVYKRIFDASWQAQTYVENSNARQWAENESLSRIIGAVKSASGIRLDNPQEGGFEDEGAVLARERLGDGYGAARAQGPRALDPYRMQAFEQRLAQLVESDPKIADAVAVAKIDFSPIMVTRRAEMDLQATFGDAGSAIGAMGAAIGGGVAPSFRDPINAAGLFLGAGPSAAKTVAGRIASVALREGLVNAGITAAQQPFVQDYRREAGLEAGLGEAIQNIALALGVGGVLGGGVQGVRDIVGRATRGELAPADLRQAIDRAGLELPADERAALQVAERADADDALAMRDAPTGIPREEAVEVLRQAVRYAEDPVNEPLPDLPIALPMIRADRAAVVDERLPAKPGDVATVDGKPVSFERFDPATIGTDAAAMQYKGGADVAGVTDRLRSVTRWDPLAGGRVFVFERADGTRVIADGHQRLGLAKRLASDSEPAELVGHLFREADGWTAADVRAMAAKKNMQEGSGTALDAARVLRDRPDLADGALPVSGPMMRQAMHLARLSDEAFGMVNAGVVPEAYGARVGAMVADPLQHVAILTDLVRFKPETEREASILIGESMRAGFVSERQEDMFGALDRSVSLMAERVKVLDQAVRQLATDKRVFAMLGREAERIEAGGNVLAATNTERAAAAAEMQQLVVSLAQRMGPISDLLTSAARAVKEGGRAPDAARGFLDQVAQAIERDGLPRLMSDPALRPVETVEPGTPQALAAAERVELRQAGPTPAASSKPVAEWKAAQPADIRALFELAAPMQRELADAGQAVAAALGVRFIDPGMKAREAAEQKIARKSYDDARSLTDVVRGGFVITSDAQRPAIVEALAARFEIADEGFKATQAGYADQKILVRFGNGVVGEVQIVGEAMQAAKKGAGHQLYRKARALPQGSPERAALEIEMRAVYSAAAAVDAKASAGSGGSLPNLASNSAADTGVPLSATSSESTGRQAPLSTAQASPGEYRAGRPSQSVNDGDGITSQAQTSASMSSGDNLDLFGDAIPLASRDDPMGVRVVSREEALAEAEKTGFAADLVASCKTGA